jgi:hypothetical protein
MTKVTVGQVAEQAINRLQSRIDTLQAGIERRDLTIVRQQEQMRELLSYCRSQAQHSGYALEESAYEDIAGKMRGMLDGEQ